ncbi:hypothetical protein H4S01_003501 [Coemansia sp. RSA 2610]|nr:hypothetical protein H4S01_003501 [Coemansia sp. RSA 2610]
MELKYLEARRVLHEVLQSPEALSCDAILLSGGLDTSIAAEIITEQSSTSKLRTGITVTIEPTSNPLAHQHGLFTRQPQDIYYATKIAAKCGLDHHVLKPTLADLTTGAAMDLCTRVLRTFEPMELRNAVVIAHALLRARELGCKRVCTGDGADELFAGYAFMHQMDARKLPAYIQNMAQSMRFCAAPLAQALGLSVWSPFLHKRTIEFATLGIPRSLLIGEFDGVQHGKLILRQAFPDVVSAARIKEPIECGCGTVVMPAFAELLVPDDEFAREVDGIKTQHQVTVRDKERLVYFRSFKRTVLESDDVMKQLTRNGASACPDCHFDLDSPAAEFCRVCGWYPGLLSN